MIGVKPNASPAGVYRFIMGDRLIKAGEDVHDDVRYAARIKQMHADARPLLELKPKRWLQLRDGYTDAAGVKHLGFWINEDNSPLQPGDNVPKDAFYGMEGALMQIMWDTGVYWTTKPKREKTASAFQDGLARSRIGKELEADGDDEDEGDDGAPG